MEDFSGLFGRNPSVRTAASGRVNLIGEHTDYNDGLVLPLPLALQTQVELAPRADRRVRVASANRPIVEARAAYLLGEEQPGHGWLDYIQGITWHLRATGQTIAGFDARVESALPLGGGLASSAALMVGLLRALRAAFGLALDDVAIALAARAAENDFVGARVGIMDQFAASLGQLGAALFLDTRDLRYEAVPLPPGFELVILDSGQAHQHATGGYNTRRAECERARALLGIASLRDLTAEQATAVASGELPLPEPLGRRVRHVWTENARVRGAVEALRAGDLPRLGALFNASHLSQRDDYAVSTPAIDRLVTLAQEQPAVLGARLTGGGFGGPVLILTRKGQGAAVGERVGDAYARHGGYRPTPLVVAS